MPFRIALSGLKSASDDLQVTGNNIANATTTGFKKSRAEFVDVYALAYGALSGTAPGSGVRTSNVRQLFAQGNTEYTDNATDLAISGQGFFVVADDTGRFLSRNGAFGIDRDGYVKNATGQTLQIFPAETIAGITTFNTGRYVDLQLQNAIGAPVATSDVRISLNLNSDPQTELPTGQQAFFDINGTAGGIFEDGNPVPIAAPQDTGLNFNPSDPTTYYKATSTTVYDTLGGAHTLTFYFRKLEDTSAGGPLNNTWQAYTYIDNTRVDASVTGALGGGSSGSPVVLDFDTAGQLQNATYDDGTAAGAAAGGPIAYSNFVTSNGSAPVQLTIDFGAITQFGSDFAINEISQNGFTTGRLTGFDVEESGVVFARYTNGNKEVLGMVGLANVPNPEGLGKEGDSLWAEAFEAGDTIFGQPGTSTFGLIQAGALEASTVEIADELVQMIVAQRNYQANAQVISTADQITQTLLNIR